jgi:hypothetical protein
VHPHPFISGPVAVLSRCTDRQVPQQSSNVAAPRRLRGFLPPPRVVAASYRWPIRQVASRIPGARRRHIRTCCAPACGQHTAGRPIPWRPRAASGVAVTAA